MRLSSSFAAPSAVAILSIALLCGLSGTAVSQTATGSPAALPGITVEAPKQVATPHRPKQSANTVASRRIASTARTSTAGTPSPAPDSVLGRLAKLEKAASTCNGGCITNPKTGNVYSNACSESAFSSGTIALNCVDTLTFKNYADCVETKWFLGENHKRISWHCSSLYAGGKLRDQQVAELKLSRH